METSNVSALLLKRKTPSASGSHKKDFQCWKSHSTRFDILALYNETVMKGCEFYMIDLCIFRMDGRKSRSDFIGVCVQEA